MEAELIVVGGKASKKAVTVKLPSVVGRSREADVIVAHPMVSRRHCELFEVDGLLKIRDLGSLNGTVTGGQRVSEASLRPDDEFTVGPLTFRVAYQYDENLDAVSGPEIAEGTSPSEAESTGQASQFEPLDEVEEVDDRQGEREGQPEPTPPPPPPASQTMAAAEEVVAGPGDGAPTAEPRQEQPDVAAWEEIQTQTAEQFITHVRDAPEAPPPKKGRWRFGRGRREDKTPQPEAQRDTGEINTVEEPTVEEPVVEAPPPKTVETGEVEPPPEFFAGINPDADQSRPAKNNEDELNEFLKGL